jgi:ABC-2 type transport system ATP-binding protein
MRQKLGIVQAVQHEPELLVLDEPTEGLDPLVQEGFYALVRGLVGGGATVLFSSHVLSEVEVLCERIGMIRDGRMIAVRRLEELRADLPRIVRLELADEAATRAFALPGAERLEVEGRRVRFAWPREPAALLRALAPLAPVDVEIEKASLEEIFLGLYRDEPA